MYQSFYGLHTKPFQLGPDPRFFYASHSHKRALAYLRYGVRQGEGFIVITGDVGTGKSTLVGALFRTLESENVTAAQVVTTQLEADDLLRMVAAAYGLPHAGRSKAELLQGLETYFRSCVQEGKRVLLVVDEAQNLPRAAMEELRMLSNFQAGGKTLLQSFLLGQKEFRVTLRSEGLEQLRQRVIAAYHLRPLDLDETRGYIEHRLHTGGWRGDPQLAEDVYPAIHGFTGGVPRRINTLCDRLLLYGYLEELHALDGEALGVVGRDLVEEQGGQRRELEPLPGAPAPGPAPDAGAGGPAPGSNEARLDAVERSLARLGESMREELGRLREALARDKGSGGPDRET